MCKSAPSVCKLRRQEALASAVPARGWESDQRRSKTTRAFVVHGMRCSPPICESSEDTPNDDEE